MKTLKTLAVDQGTTVTIISGRKRDLLEQWFKEIPVRLVAEHGVWVKEPEREWTLLKPLNTIWKESVIPILEQHSERLPGSFVEEKEYSVVWHFRGADPEHGELMAAELMDTLIGFTANVEAQVLRGNKIVEVRSQGVTKGIVGEDLIRRADDDFVLFIGDDWTDEDLFRVLPTTAYSIKVGMAKTHARWMVRGVGDVHALLGLLASHAEQRTTVHEKPLGNE
jgi:trehalose 6-phosphate synthase/phosphatase